MKEGDVDVGSWEEDKTKELLLVIIIIDITIIKQGRMRLQPLRFLPERVKEKVIQECLSVEGQPPACLKNSRECAPDFTHPNKS